MYIDQLKSSKPIAARLCWSWAFFYKGKKILNLSYCVLLHGKCSVKERKEWSEDNYRLAKLGTAFQLKSKDKIVHIPSFSFWLKTLDHVRLMLVTLFLLGDTPS